MYLERHTVYTHAERAEAWSSAAKIVETYSDEMIKRWKEEIDTYLVFVRRRLTPRLEITCLTE